MKTHSARLKFRLSIFCLATAFSMAACGGSGDSESGTSFKKILATQTLTIAAQATYSNQVHLSWDRVSNLNDSTEVLIEYGLKDSGVFNPYSSSSTLGALGQNIDGLQAQTSYDFRARMKIGSDFSAYSDVKSATTLSGGAASWAAPENLSASPAYVSSVYKMVLTWAYPADKSLSGIDHIQLLKRVGSSGPFSEIFSREGTDVSLTSFDDTQVVYPNEYTYKLVTTYTDGTPSTEVSVTRIMDLFVAPFLPVPNPFMATGTLSGPPTSRYLSKVDLTWVYSAPPSSEHNGFTLTVIRVDMGVPTQVSNTVISNPSQTAFSINTVSICTVSGSSPLQAIAGRSLRFELRATSSLGNTSSAPAIQENLGCDGSV